jgi:hypothetical protein
VHVGEARRAGRRGGGTLFARMIGRAPLGSLRLWKWFAIGAASLSVACRLAYAFLCWGAIERVFPGLVAVRNGCAMPHELAIANDSYLGALYRVASFSPIASAFGILAFAAFVLWARALFAAAAVVAPRGTRLAAPFEIVLMWLVPLIHLFMPFWYFQDLLRACDPSDLEPVETVTTPPSGYRTPGIVTTDTWRRPWLPFRAWWALWVVSLASYPAALYLATVTARDLCDVTFLHFEAVRSLVAIALAVSIVVVVRAASEIVEERGRRLEAIART